MKISGTASLRADTPRVYAALHDPLVLRTVIPGCELLEEVVANEYRMLVTVGVGAVKGTYKGEVRLAEHDPPHSFVLKASGAGGPGTVAAECRILLIDNADGTTIVEYDADAVVGGMVAGVGQRMLAGVAKKLAGQFFGAVDDVLCGRRSAVAVPTAGVEESAAVESTAVPHSVAAGQGSPQRQFVGGAAAGATAALAGVVVGWLAGRSGRRGERP